MSVLNPFFRQQIQDPGGISTNPTPVVDTWEPKTANKAIETLATEVIEDKQPVALPF